jgi:hypothetical protein
MYGMWRKMVATHGKERQNTNRNPNTTPHKRRHVAAKNSPHPKKKKKVTLQKTSPPTTPKTRNRRYIR